VSIFSDLTPEKQKTVRERLRQYGAHGISTIEDDGETIYSLLRNEVPQRFGGKPKPIKHEPTLEWKQDITSE